MTTIAGFVDTKKVVIVADSRVSQGDMRVDQTVTSPKIFEGVDTIIASAGLLSEASLFSLFARDHSIGPAGGELRILEWLLEFSEWKDMKTKNEKIENGYLIGHQSGLYKVLELSVFPIKKYAAIGCGVYYALTALHLGKTVFEAVEIACDLDAFTDRPISSLSIKLKKKQ